MSVEWLAQTPPECGALLRVGRDGERLVAEWPGIGRLTVDRTGDNPRFTPCDHVDASVVAKLQTGAIPALLRHVRGDLTLHASAIAAGGEAAAFIGDSGAGKSTLAFALSTRSKGNWALLSDDCTSISDGSVLPTDHAAWIDREAKTALGVLGDETRSAVPAPRVAGQPARLRWLVHLTFGDTVSVSRLRGIAVARLLTRAAIRFVVDEPDVNRADLSRFAHLAEQTKVLELSRPKRWEDFPATLSALESWLGA